MTIVGLAAVTLAALVLVEPGQRAVRGWLGDQSAGCEEHATVDLPLGQEASVLWAEVQ